MKNFRFSATSPGLDLIILLMLFFMVETFFQTSKHRFQLFVGHIPVNLTGHRGNEDKFS